MGNTELGIGVVGCGGFGLYAMQHFTQIPGINLLGMASTSREAAYAAARRFDIPDPVELTELVARPELDLVYIATPPFLHYEQALEALEAGKHVICEKPLAMDLKQADEMIALAKEKDLLLIANLMQRYNPLFETMKELIDSAILGDVLHCYFENYANDEGLPPQHWFWDREKSGGIFIEHGVHFFDLFRGWLGEGTVEAAQVAKRPGTEIEDQVQCTVRYRDSILVNFYHGFTQVGRMDRQEMRFLFERGDVTLHEWVPTQVQINAVADEENTRKLMELFPGAKLDISENYGPKDRACMGRHKSLDIYQKLVLSHGHWNNKMHLYGRLLRAMIEDQKAWIEDRTHQRKVTEDNGRESLATAVRATELAH